MFMDKRRSTAMILRSLLLAVAMLCVTFNSTAQTSSTLIVQSETSRLNQAVISRLQAMLPDTEIVDLKDIGKQYINANKIISLGNEACEILVINKIQVPVVCAMVRQNFHPGNIGAHNFKYIPLEVPLDYFIHFARLIDEGLSRVGILLGPSAQFQQGYFEQVVKRHNIDVDWALLSEDSNPVMGLQPAMRYSGIFIVIPDAASFNLAVAPWVLKMSLRYGIPVLGYSFSYANSGALASLYQSEQDIANNILALLNGDNTGQFNFSLRLNYTVARNLGITLQSEQDYLKKLMQDSAK